MATRGEVALVLSTILKSSNILNTRQYVICVTVVILTAIISPILLSFGFKRQDKLQKRKGERYSVIIKNFKYISSRYLFDIISSNLEKTHKIKPIIDLVEGKKVLTVGKQNIEIILDPEIGIQFSGKEEKIRPILDNLKTELNKEVEKMPGKIIEH